MQLFGIPLEFLLFALTLLGVAVFHKHPLTVSLVGLAAIAGLELLQGGMDWQAHFQEEWKILANLLGLLLGFAVLARHFEDSHLPLLVPRILPDDWKGPFLLLALVFLLSAFLDNIAAALIGGAVAHTVFKGRVHVGYLAGLVAAANAGGAGSVLGDTTTTMLWIDGVKASEVVHAYVGAGAAFLGFGFFAARQQDKHQRIVADSAPGVRVDGVKLGITVAMLVGAVIANLLWDFPALGLWAALLAGAAFTRTPWKVLPAAFAGACFLLALVLCASLMPVEKLPAPTWASTLVLGFISAVFDNIPLTKLALEQGGYDWGFLAYAVGFGGSMIWFGSSAGVALSGMYPEVRSVGKWLKSGWPITLGYLLGFSALLGLLGWHPR